MATKVSRGKMRLAAFEGPFLKTPLQTQKSRKYVLHKPNYSPFCPKLRCHGNQKGSGVKLNDTIILAVPKTIRWNQKLRPFYTKPKLWPF